MKIKLYHILLFFLLSTIGSFAQQQLPSDQYLQSRIQERSFDKAVWEEKIEGIDYSKSINEVDVDDDEEGTQGEFSQGRESSSNQNKSNWKIGEGWDAFFKVLFVLLLVFALGFILYRILISSFKQPREKKLNSRSMEINLEEIEENLHESNLDHFINEAIKKGDYSLAVRLYYLAVIKELSQRKLIKWKRDKTNFDYLQELKNPQLKVAFQAATSVFERIWYGKAAIDTTSFEQLHNGFQQLIREIKNIDSVPHAE